LNFLKRNLGFIEEMLKNGGTLTEKQQAKLEILKTLYTQQRTMHNTRENRIPDRIVSITQPHIRTQVRGKAGRPYEFGAKVTISTLNGYTFIDEASYKPYYEGAYNHFENSIIDYYTRFGVLPVKILADSAYNTRDNRELCKKLKIKLMGKPLGRPPKGTIPHVDEHDISGRNEIEGDIGTLKTRYGWNRIMARLPETGMTAIAMSVLAMNLSKKAKDLLRLFFKELLFSSFRSFLV